MDPENSMLCAEKPGHSMLCSQQPEKSSLRLQEPKSRTICFGEGERKVKKKLSEDKNKCTLFV
jgi:hypothetical protein